MKNNWNKILNELSYRVSSGIPDLSNEQHLMKLWDILKEHNWNIDARVELLKNLDEMSIVKNKKSGNIYPVKKFKPQTQTIVKKDATKDDIKKAQQGAGEDEFDTPQASTSVDSVEIEPEEAPEKNKELDQDVETTNEFNEGKLSEDGVSDEDFENNEKIQEVKNPMSIEELENTLPKPLPFPKKYVKVLHRLLNTENKGKITISDFTDAAGGGTLESTAGEIMTMIGMSITDNEKANKFYDMIEAHAKNNKDTIISSSWAKSGKEVRQGIMDRYDRAFGKGNWSFKNAAWDIKEEVEALGMEDYKRDKGFSTDVYFTIEVDGKTILDEVSLKKDDKANLLNATSGRMSDIIIRGNATTEEFERYDSLYGKTQAELSKDDKKFLKEIREKYYTEEIPDNVKVTKVKARQEKLHNDSLSKNNDAIRKDVDNFLSMSREEQLKSMVNIARELNQTPFEKWAETNLDDYKKLFEEIKNTEGELSLDNLKSTLKKSGEKTDMRNMQKTSAVLQVLNPESESKKDFNKIKENSHDHAQATADYLLSNETAKKGLLKSIREDFPLQSLLSGEESMHLGDLSADKDTLKNIFGVDSFEQLEQNLTIRETPEPASIVYSVEGKESIPIAEVNTRPDGIGYGGTWKLEMKVHKEFAGKLKEQNTKGK
jgi:hypothetical protein|tara:strand:- start:495 stop:2468 length:1974 start_codon:yes stop_codon:yes gene_type:complete